MRVITSYSIHYTKLYELVWLESQQHGTRWVEHIIDPNLPVARCLSVDDIDGDGRLDVVAGGARGQSYNFV